MTDNKFQELHKKLFSYVDEQNRNWKSFVYAKDNGFYQGFDEIRINGCRSTEKRFERYNIEDYLSINKTALDIGCNCGFFTIFASRHLKEITGIEINPYLVKIANETKKFLNIKNSEFSDISFENFKTDKKYDIIFSLANDETIDGNTKFTFKEYISKIYELLNNKGILVFETVAPDTYEPRLFKPKFEILKQTFTILKDHMVKTEYPINVPERRFLVLKK
jgi:2-polyprenyl-3-methyl-5-hydroxy-6-metoxy-1,4-benzoquinol methylase